MKPKHLASYLLVLIMVLSVLFYVVTRHLIYLMFEISAGVSLVMLWWGMRLVHVLAQRGCEAKTTLGALRVELYRVLVVAGFIEPEEEPLECGDRIYHVGDTISRRECRYSGMIGDLIVLESSDGGIFLVQVGSPVYERLIGY